MAEKVRIQGKIVKTFLGMSLPLVEESKMCVKISSICLHCAINCSKNCPTPSSQTAPDKPALALKVVQ